MQEGKAIFRGMKLRIEGKIKTVCSISLYNKIWPLIKVYKFL